MTSPHLGEYPRVICAWCPKVIETAPQPVELVSHGMCADCDQKIAAELDLVEKPYLRLVP